MKSFFILSIIFCSLLLCLSPGCKPKKTEDEKADVDKKAMLSNIGNNIIIPNYKALKVAIDKLDSATTAFNLNPDNTNLTNLQNLFKEAYRIWQTCSPFDLGPAETEYLRVNMNTFPTDTTLINSNISAGGYDINSIANWKAKGLPGVDYLLYGTGADNNEILLQYTTDADAAKRKTYLAVLTADMKTKVTTVVNAWLSTEGNYINTFINADGTDIGSSLGLLVNQLNYDLEIIKNFKVGTPLGKQTLGVFHPEKTEGYYSGISVELALLQLQTIEDIFLGRSNQGNGFGFDDYLDQIGAQYNGGSLSTTIKNQFTSAITKLQLVPDPLSSSIQNNTTAVDAAYVELQKLVVLLKTDMPSEMGILITYVDNDGD
jgi:predicted lipoprotein